MEYQKLYEDLQEKYEGLREDYVESCADSINMRHEIMVLKECIRKMMEEYNAPSPKVNDLNIIPSTQIV